MFIFFVIGINGHAYMTCIGILSCSIVFIEIFFWHFPKMFYFGGPNTRKYFLEKCFYMHNQTLKILFRCIS